MKFFEAFLKLGALIAIVFYFTACGSATTPPTSGSASFADTPSGVPTPVATPTPSPTPVASPTPKPTPIASATPPLSCNTDGASVFCTGSNVGAFLDQLAISYVARPPIQIEQHASVVNSATGSCVTITWENEDADDALSNETYCGNAINQDVNFLEEL